MKTKTPPVKEIIHTLSILSLGYQVANEFDYIPCEDDWIEKVHQSFPVEEFPDINILFERYGGYSHSDMVSAIISYIEYLENTE